jgi:CRISPR-associated endonuclease/helicase Cas3
MKHIRSLRAMPRVLASLAQLVALSHDIGKATSGFQEMLRAVVKSLKDTPYEYLRHEAVSYLLLRQATSEGRLEALNALALPQFAPPTYASAEALCAAFSAYLKEDLTLLREVATGKNKASLPLEDLCARLIAFLALTHHKLPGAKDYDAKKPYTYTGSQSDAQHVRRGSAGRWEKSLCFPQGLPFAENGSTNRLGDRWVALVHELKSLCAQHVDSLPPAELVQLAMAYVRPLFVLSDCIGSAQKSTLGFTDEPLLANLYKSEDKGDLPGDGLQTHIGKVLAQAAHLSCVFEALAHGDMQGFPALSNNALANLDDKRCSEGAFGWQGRLHDHIKDSACELPAFVVVTAETGSGKTIASGQIARALGSSRFTYCLGLRSLTLQTGQAYRRDLGFSNEDLVTLIGDEVAQRAFELTGSESMEQGEFLADGAPDIQALELALRPEGGLALGLKEKLLALVAAPVLVCTIDQIIGVTQLTKVRRAAHYLRVYSADLVLDEIDNYSPLELKQIQRLCFLAGLARKHVICLSATAGPLHVDALVQEYQAGLRLNACMTGAENTFRLIQGSNVSAPRTEVIADAAAEAPLAVRGFNQETLAQLAAKRPKARIRILPESAYSFGGITRAVLDLARLNQQSVTLPSGTSISVATGFVRFNTVKLARSYAKFLYETNGLEAGTEISLVCYHAKYTPLEHSAIDRCLKVLTRRKADTQAGFGEAAIAQYLAPLHARTGCQNLILLVVCTSILETGRDHDYDFAVLEPNSHRSLIQSAGRVLRHRAARDVPYNLGIIETPAKADEPGGDAKSPLEIWRYPGPLTYIDLGAGKQHADVVYKGMLRRAESTFKLPSSLLANSDWRRDGRASGLMRSDYAQGVSSAIALKDPSELTNPVALLEQYALSLHLTAPSKDSPMAKAYKAVSGRVIREHHLQLTDWAYRHPFRDIEEDVDRVYISGRSPSSMPAHLVLANGARAAISIEDVSVVRASRILQGLPYLNSVEDEALKVRNRYLTEEHQVYATAGFSEEDLTHLMGYGINAPGFWYSPLLGFNDKPCEAERIGRLA